MIFRICLALPLALSCYAQIGLFQIGAGGETPVPSLMDLGAAAPGDALDTRFRVRNTGAGTVNIQSVSLAGFDFAIPPESLRTLPVPLAPGTFLDFRVRFSPAAEGSYSANLLVNAPGAALNVVLRAHAAPSAALFEGNAAAPLAAGAAVDFGSVQRGSSLLHSFRLSNPGTAAVQISTVSVTGAGFRGPIGLTAPLQLAPGDSVIFQIAFEPQSPQPAQGALSIGPRTFQLTGLGLDFPLPTAAIAFDSPVTASAKQARISIPLSAAAKTGGTGTLTLEFQSSVPGVTDDPAVQFLSGPKRVATVTIAPGDTVAKFGTAASLGFQTGTTAGTISFTLKLPNGAQQASYAIAPAAISLDTAGGARRVNDLDVNITGFDNTHSASLLKFTFYDRKGAVIQPGAITVDATADFRRYFEAGPAGGAFAFRATFPVTGDATQVGGVDVELNNTAGVTRTQRIAF